MLNQMPYQPLQAYIDEKSIQEHVQSWQQILLSPGSQPFIISQMEIACLEFCIELLNQKIKVHEYKSLLVLKVAHFMVVQKVLWLDPEYIDIIYLWAAATQLGSRTGDAADDGLGLIIEDPGYANSTFGLKIHYNTTALEQVTWIGEEQLLYKEMEFTMGQFSDHDQWPAIPWDRLFDNPSKDIPGWSFLQDPHTPWPVAGGTWLVDWMAREPPVARAFLTQGAVSPTKLEKYFQQVARFKEKLAVAIHLTSSALARAPELLSIYMVVFVTAYHKGFHTSNDIKIIHHMKLATINTEELDGMGDIIDKEPSHTTHMAGMLYSRESTGLTNSATT
ncbi:hypothetical protein BDW68DRAFT_190056 [Aspergillus falconensis]